MAENVPFKISREKINEIIESDEGIAMFHEVLLSILNDEDELARLRSEEKYQLDQQSLLVDAERKGEERGRKEGEERGRVEASLENARKMKALGIPVEQIQAVTGLDAETIEKL